MATTELTTTVAGQSVTIRPVQPADTALYADFIRGLSDRTRHLRFLAGVHELPQEELEGFCSVDGQRTMAFIATVADNGSEVQVGACRYAPNEREDIREIAVTVADAWQDSDLGLLLTRQLIAYARSHSVKELYSLDTVDNTEMRELADELGMTATQDPEDRHQVIYSLAL